MGKQKQSKRGKKPDKRPARANYKHSGNLAGRKIRQLVRHGRTLQGAMDVLTATRKRPIGVLPPGRTLQRIAEYETERRLKRKAARARRLEEKR